MTAPTGPGPAAGTGAGLPRVGFTLPVEDGLSAPQLVAIARGVEAAGFDEVILYFNVGLKPHRQVLDEMARFSEQVAPAFA